MWRGLFIWSMSPTSVFQCTDFSRPLYHSCGFSLMWIMCDDNVFYVHVSSLAPSVAVSCVPMPRGFTTRFWYLIPDDSLCLRYLRSRLSGDSLCSPQCKLLFIGPTWASFCIAGAASGLLLYHIWWQRHVKLALVLQSVQYHSVPIAQKYSIMCTFR